MGNYTVKAGVLRDVNEVCFLTVSDPALQPGDIVLFGHCGLGVPGHIAVVANVDPATGLVSTIDSARHGSVVGFRAQQNPATWEFDTARRFVG